MCIGWESSPLPALTHLPDYELVGVCTAHQGRRGPSSLVPLAFHDHQEMLHHPDIDAVAVVVRVPLHCCLTMDALRAGKHVLTEWPLGRTSAKHRRWPIWLRGGSPYHGRPAGSLCPACRLKEPSTGLRGGALCHLTQIRPGVLNRTSGRTWQRDHSRVLPPSPSPLGMPSTACACASASSPKCRPW
jgi:hypothetical protein